VDGVPQVPMMMKVYVHQETKLVPLVNLVPTKLHGVILPAQMLNSVGCTPNVMIASHKISVVGAMMFVLLAMRLVPSLLPTTAVLISMILVTQTVLFTPTVSRAQKQLPNVAGVT